jgi:anti-sigma regulatory factor (Ser/Thr protein kinase)
MAAEPESVRLLRTEVLRWLREQELGDTTLAAAIGLATSEAVANVVRHAYSQEHGRVELEASLDGDGEVMIRVTDRGLGLRTRGGARTGLGLPVIGRVSNGVTVASDDEGTTVSMRFQTAERRRGLRRQRFGSNRPLVGIG